MRYLSLVIPGPDGGYNINPVDGMPEGGETALENIIQWGVTSLLVVATLIALAFLIYGGIKWITSGGDKNGIQSARQTIVYALIGLVIVFLSFFIIRVIGGFFGVELIDFPRIGGGGSGGGGRPLPI